MTAVVAVRRPSVGRVFSIVAGLPALALSSAGPVAASPSVQFGVQDDAWLLHGPGTLDARMTELGRLGVDIVRVTLRWDEIAWRKARESTRSARPRIRLERR